MGLSTSKCTTGQRCPHAWARWFVSAALVPQPQAVPVLDGELRVGEGERERPSSCGNLAAAGSAASKASSPQMVSNADR